jgi:hypothetical protein
MRSFDVGGHRLAERSFHRHGFGADSLGTRYSESMAVEVEKRDRAAIWSFIPHRAAFQWHRAFLGSDWKIRPP